jgi:hypothetical protein
MGVLNVSESSDESDEVGDCARGDAASGENWKLRSWGLLVAKKLVSKLEDSAASISCLIESWISGTVDVLYSHSWHILDLFLRIAALNYLT